MNGFNTGLSEMMEDIFCGLKVTKEEEKNIKNRMHIVSARRDEDGVLSVKYDDGQWIRYKVK